MGKSPESPETRGPNAPEGLETDLEAVGGGAGAADTRAHLFVRLEASTDVLVLEPDDEIIVGRSSDVDVRVDSSGVSRHHAKIRHLGTHLEVEDLGSRNGTFLNGKRVEGRASLSRGDEVGVSTATLVLVAAPPPTRERVLAPTRELETSLARGASSRPASERALERRATRAEPATDIVAIAPKMIELLAMVRKLALVPTTVLILGETGVGKEVLAEELHRAGPRTAGPCVRVNCAALPEQLVESELFGHERGAFTGAEQRRIGHVEAANRGTLFLDEVGDLSLGTQAKLLRVLETKRIQKLGSAEEIAVDVRFVCATHDLGEAVAAGRFRRDLYYRIAGFVLEVPPLRERTVEIAPLAERFAASFAERTGVNAPRLDARAVAELMSYRWPGNVRELRNAIEHAVIVAGGDVIGVEHLPSALRLPVPIASVASPEQSMRDQVADVERSRIEAALAAHGGNQTHAARELGISRRTLLYKLAKYRRASSSS